MFISNPNSIPNKFKCNKIIYNYLKDKLPLLSRENNLYYFANTEKLNHILNSAPLYIKIALKLNN